jgi:hypothetical protein
MPEVGSLNFKFWFSRRVPANGETGLNKTKPLQRAQLGTEKSGDYIFTSIKELTCPLNAKSVLF